MNDLKFVKEGVIEVMKISKQLKAALAFAGVALLSASASASNYAYVCYSAHFPGSGSNGSYGYISASTYSGPACSGNYLGTIRLCTKNATSNSCPASSTALHSEASILNASSGLREAAKLETKVWVYTTACTGGGDCAYSIEYFR